jgi:hypothetical protein
VTAGHALLSGQQALLKAKLQKQKQQQQHVQALKH